MNIRTFTNGKYKPTREDLTELREEHGREKDIKPGSSKPAETSAPPPLRGIGQRHRLKQDLTESVLLALFVGVTGMSNKGRKKYTLDRILDLLKEDKKDELRKAIIKTKYGVDIRSLFSSEELVYGNGINSQILIRDVFIPYLSEYIQLNGRRIWESYRSPTSIHPLEDPFLVGERK